MASMTRFFSQTQSLTRKPHLLLQPHPSLSSITPRHQSNKPHQPQLIELDLDSSTSQNDTVEVVSVSTIRNLDEILQSIIARRAAPDWLPFLPGYSYYVPPPPAGDRPGKLFEVFGQLSEINNQSMRRNGLYRDETMEFGHGMEVAWPSSTYFIEGTAPTHPLPMDLAVEVKIYDSEEAVKVSSSEDE